MNIAMNMAMPDFLIIGTMRGGTTSLYYYLLAHPQIAAATRKEVHFFDNNFHHGIAWYRAQFPLLIQGDGGETIDRQRVLTGEASPYYLFQPHAPARAALVVPTTRLIVLLRNPVDRAYSHYYHSIKRGYETISSFEEALAQEETRTRDEGQRLAADPYYYSYNHAHYSYLARGIYVDQLQRWMNYFPKEQFFIIKSEDFYATPERTLQEIFLFLGLPDGASVQQESKQFGCSTYQAKMEPETRKRLLGYFEPYNKRLYTLLGRDFGWDR